MARERGQFNFSGNLEIKKTAPLDARTIIATKNELISENTWKDSDNKVWLYNGMLVVVLEDYGLYILNNYDPVSTPNAYKTIGNWVRIGNTELASNTVIGGIKTGYIDDNANKNYGVKIDNSTGQAYVNVPWESVTLDDISISTNTSNYLKINGTTIDTSIVDTSINVIDGSIGLATANSIKECINYLKDYIDENLLKWKIYTD